MSESYDGKDSEWNEGALKSKRLDEIQELINHFKMNPLGMTNGKFNYEGLLRAIESLLGEGISWYTSTERDDVEKLKERANKCFKLMPPHIKIENSPIYSNQKNRFMFNQKNFDALMDTLWDFEIKVKDLNNDHGLSSKNRDDDEGL